MNKSEEKLRVIVQHYISQGILRLFSENKKFVYELNIKKGNIYHAGVSTTMSDKYTYEHPFLEGNALENAFKLIEDKYIPQITQIVTMLDEGEIVLAKRVIENLMKTILLFYYRSGAILYEFSDNNDFTKEEVINSLLDRITDYSYLDRLSSVIINDYSFFIIKSEDSQLVLNDQYVSTASLDCKGMISNFSNRTIGFSNCLILIPLSAKYYAVYYNGRFSLTKNIINDHIYCLDSEDLKRINKVLVRNSYNKCVAMHRDELEEVNEYKSTICGPVGTIIKYKDGKYYSCTVKKEVFFYDRDEEIFNNYVRYYSEMVEFHKRTGRHIGRNDLCLCGSGIKYKRCCEEKYKQAQFLANMIQSNQTAWMHTKSNFVEKPINEFWGLEINLPKSPCEIVKGLREINELKILLLI